MTHLVLDSSTFLLFLIGSAVAVYVKNEEVSTKPPSQVEELPWLSFFDHKSPTQKDGDSFSRKWRGRLERQNAGMTSFSTLCLPGETGQFPYPPDCKRFINCWKGRGAIQVCSPGTLFNSEINECDFPGKVKCAEGDLLPSASSEKYVRFPHQRPAIAHNPRIARTNQNVEQVKPETIPARPYPGRPPYFGPSHLKPSTRPTNQSSQGREVRPQCTLGATGLFPHPTDCTKFLKCWSGNTFIQNCGPGTFFNPLISACDHPKNAPCIQEVPEVSGDPGLIEKDINLPEESVVYEQYQDVNQNAKSLKTKGEQKIPKLDQTFPDQVILQPEVISEKPKVDIDEIETSDYRKPKVINTGDKKWDVGQEPVSYLTPPYYDVYGNLITSHNKQPSFNEQPGSSLNEQRNEPKEANQFSSSAVEVQVEVKPNHPVNYPENPIFMKYPLQGPYSITESEDPDTKKTSNTKVYYGYLLNKKNQFQVQPPHPVNPFHSHHFQYPHHPHHSSHSVHPYHFSQSTHLKMPPMYLQPPPEQRQHVLYYAPNHLVYSKDFPIKPQYSADVPQQYYPVPYHPTCIRSNSKEPSAPPCEDGFNKPDKTQQESTPSGTSQTIAQSGYILTGYPGYPNQIYSIKPTPDNYYSNNYQPGSNIGIQKQETQSNEKISLNQPNIPNYYPLNNSPIPGSNQYTSTNPNTSNFNRYSPVIPLPSGPNQYPSSILQSSDSYQHFSNIPQLSATGSSTPQISTPSQYPSGSSQSSGSNNYPFQNILSTVSNQNSAVPESNQYPYNILQAPGSSQYPYYTLQVTGSSQNPSSSLQGLQPKFTHGTQMGKENPQYQPSTANAPSGTLQTSYTLQSPNQYPQSTGMLQFHGTLAPQNSQSTANEPQKIIPGYIYPVYNPVNDHQRDHYASPNTDTQQSPQMSHSVSVNPEGQVLIPVTLDIKDNKEGSKQRPSGDKQKVDGPFLSNINSNDQKKELPSKLSNKLQDSSSQNVLSVSSLSTTFPPFPGNSEKSKTNTKTIITKKDQPQEYILDKIDLRIKPEDAENISKESSKPSNIIPDKYSHPEESNSVVEIISEETSQGLSGKTIKGESDFDIFPLTEKPKKTPKKPYVKVKQTPPNGQTVRLRNGASHLDGYLEMKGPKTKWGLVCLEPGGWSLAEATVACRELGFIRGAELSWQGYPVKSDTEDLFVSVSGISCNGKEVSLSECNITHPKQQGCDIGRNAVGLRCFDNLASHCQPGEILYNQHCYKLHGKENLDDPGFKTEEASDLCKKFGGKLLDITSQYENDFISEWLIKKHPEVTSVATGGIGISVLGRPMWLWEGSNDPMVYERWWSGWSGDQDIPKGSINGPLCIILKKTFSCTDNESDQKNTELGKDEETCSADYFFWDVEDCENLRTSVFICERPMDDIGCVVGNGEGYVGTANTTSSGLPCLPWDHPKVVEGLARRGAALERSSRLTGHNFCRNLGNPDRHPWCFVDGKRNSEYCAIPQCWEDSVSGYSRSSGSRSTCDQDHFECKPGECIRKEWICDGQKDCTNGRDEDMCREFIQEFTRHPNRRMRGKGVEKWANTNENSCAKLCLQKKEFKCRSFSYNARNQECLLSDTNIGLSGQVVSAKGWVYHELSTDSLECSLENGFFDCLNGKCVNISNVCDRKNNCGDASDELDCARLGYELRLVGGSEKHQGRLEVKILGKWGVICDDMFDIRDANVACKELGFHLGASEVFKHSRFPINNPLFLMDHLDCWGNETSLRECRFPGWGRHNCGPDEIVGVGCRVPGAECPEGQWQCVKSKECVSTAFLCDGLDDCDDKTDEDKKMCTTPTQIRLAGGLNSTAGRLEIKHFGIWGTVCHDDFRLDAANAVCRMLGFNGPSVVKKNAFFGPGKGPIWLDNGQCFDNETDLEECRKHIGKQHNCKHDEDVSVICSQQDPNQKSSGIAPVAFSSNDDNIQNYEEKIRQVLISECSGKSQKKSKIIQSFEKVVGGGDVLRGILPWQASIRVKSGSRKSVHWCGAVVISPYHVITAGHCLRDYKKAAYFVRVGDFDTEVQDPNEKEFEIEHMYMHPEFGKNVNLNNDIGLVKVKGEIIFENDVKPACLAPSVDIYHSGTNCSISGWGSVSAHSAGYARTLKRAYIPILEPSVCRAPFVYGESLSEGMFCAGHLDGEVDSCQGDSGGPLMCHHEGREYLFGITSWGHGCGRANKPGVYTNVAFYSEWIQKKIKSSLA